MHAPRRGHSPLSSPPSLPTLASTDQSSPGRTFPFLRLALAIRTPAYAKETTKNVPANGANMDVLKTSVQYFLGEDARTTRDIRRDVT